VVWARDLAGRGAVAAAAAVAWQVPELRGEACEWLDRAIDVGGVSGASAVAMLVALRPESFERASRAARAVSEEPGPDGVSQRSALADALAAQPDPRSRALLRAVARGVIRDATTFPSTEGPRRAAAVAKAADPCLAEDLPSFPAAERGASLAERRSPLRLSVTARDAGALRVHDAALLPRGRVLLALGELGARICERDGRVVASFDAPTSRIVSTIDGTRALLLASRGGANRVHRLDVGRRVAVPWGTVSFDAACDGFDGALWFVARGDSLLGLDVQHPEPRAVWHVTKLGTRLERLTWRPERVVAIGTGDGGQVERLLWTLPGPRLSRRDPVDPTAAGTGGWDVAVAGSAVQVRNATGTLVLELELAGASEVRARVGGERPHLVACDDLGRVRAIDLRDGAVVRDLRIS
jgi:hypothetical protein